jgi:DNA-binding NtrC family response regulator
VQMNVSSVLVVDDDIAVCRILQRMLSDEKYQVQTSQSVADALAAIEQKCFDVYVMDYKLPDGTGLDVAERIRAKGNEAPIILISGYDPSAIALRAEKLRIFDIVEKPFSRATICNAVKKALGFSLNDEQSDAGAVMQGTPNQVGPSSPGSSATNKLVPRALTVAAIVLLLLTCLVTYLFTHGQ